MLLAIKYLQSHIMIQTILIVSTCFCVTLCFEFIFYTHPAEEEGKADGIGELQNKILEVLRQEPYMGEKIPIR